MSRISKTIFLLLFVLIILSGCKKNENIHTVPLPVEFSAGEDSVIYDTLSVKMDATSVDSLNLTGTWRIISGDTMNAGFSDIHDSKAFFTGVYRENYILEWSTSNGENSLADSISVRFAASLPSDFTAGFLYLVYDTNYVELNATPLHEGLLGAWSVLTDNAADIEFSDFNISNPTCKGMHLNSYILRWTISNGIEEKYSDAKFIIGDIFIDARDNKQYKKVKIGDQVWMAEDLKADSYSNGDSLTFLPDNTSLYDFINLYDKAYFKRDVYTDFSGSVVYPINDQGYYYTWAAVMNGSISTNDNPSAIQGICPDGWHVPSAAEFDDLLGFLATDYIPNKEGQALRSDYAWLIDMDKGTNYYGFNALAKGYHYSDFYGQTGEIANFWTTQQTDYESWGHHTQAYYFNIGWNYASIWPGTKVEGRCVRCIENN
jgi:uncharacterized protein (TIGR02145 family)